MQINEDTFQLISFWPIQDATDLLTGHVIALQMQSERGSGHWEPIHP